MRGTARWAVWNAKSVGVSHRACSSRSPGHFSRSKQAKSVRNGGPRTVILPARLLRPQLRLQHGALVAPRLMGAAVLALICALHSSANVVFVLPSVETRRLQGGGGSGGGGDGADGARAPSRTAPRHSSPLISTRHRSSPLLATPRRSSSHASPLITTCHRSSPLTTTHAHSSYRRGSSSPTTCSHPSCAPAASAP